jgi:membrane protease YdiL (CAAX protease family)
MMILAAVGVLSVVMLAPQATAFWAIGILGGLAVWATAVRAVEAVHVALISLLWIGLPGLLPRLPVWPFSLLLPLLIYGAIVASIPPLRRSIRWFRAGQLRREVVVGMVATIAASAVALEAWYLLLTPDLRMYRALLPPLPAWALLLGALGFAGLNAAMEEGVFRGILFQALESALGVGAAPLVIQAVAFGLLHFVAGFPNGGWGFVMASAYGLLQGVLRRRSAGILVPWLTHVGTDLTIFVMVVA